jgi:hypothetical protein
VAAWQNTLRPLVRDAIAAYYARYPDAKPGEIEAWLRDRGFDVGLSDVEDCMAALDSRPNWRTGWINRNIHRYAGDFDPDQFLATRSYREDAGWQVAEDEFEEEAEEERAEEEYEEGEEEEYDEEEDWEENEYGEEGVYHGGVVTGVPSGVARPVGGEDRLPGLLLGVLGLAVSGGIIALVIVVLR